jgi:hypothetical protein
MTSRNLLRLTSLVLGLAAHGVGAAQSYEEEPAHSEPPAEQSDYADEITFALERAGGVANAGCVPYAKGEVNVTAQGSVEVMDVTLEGLPPDTEFAFFVTQLPNPPFGLSWYQGDMKTDAYGRASAQFMGRFNEETFIVAPGAGAAPQPHGELDAAENPATKPIHTYHIGVWFDSAYDAGEAGCPDFVTPFSGAHDAGLQVLNTASFPELAGPLSQLKP